MYPDYCLSDTHLELLGTKLLIDTMIREMKKSDRKKLHKEKLEYFKLCDEVGKLFDRVEIMFSFGSPYVPNLTDRFSDEVSFIRHRKLGSSVTGSTGVLRLMSRCFYDANRQASDEVLKSQLISDFAAAINEARSELITVKEALIIAVEKYEQELKKIRNN